MSGKWYLRFSGPGELEVTCSSCGFKDYIPYPENLSVEEYKRWLSCNYWINRHYCSNCGDKKEGIMLDVVASCNKCKQSIYLPASNTYLCMRLEVVVKDDGHCTNFEYGDSDDRLVNLTEVIDIIESYKIENSSLQIMEKLGDGVAAHAVNDCCDGLIEQIKQL